MSNFYIYFCTNLNLLFVAARLWGRIDWPWLWVMSPLIGLTVIGVLAIIGNARQNRMRSALPDNLKWITDFLRQYHEAAKKEREHTIN